MHAILFTGKNEVSLTELPDPRPGPGEVIVEVHASGICHTDIEVLRGNYGTSAFPIVPGHEYSGVVAELGPDVDGILIGDRVICRPQPRMRQVPCLSSWMDTSLQGPPSLWRYAQWRLCRKKPGASVPRTQDRRHAIRSRRAGRTPWMRPEWVGRCTFGSGAQRLDLWRWAHRSVTCHRPEGIRR